MKMKGSKGQPGFGKKMNGGSSSIGKGASKKGFGKMAASPATKK